MGYSKCIMSDRLPGKIMSRTRYLVLAVLVIGISFTLVAQDQIALRLVSQINLLKIESASGAKSDFLQDVWAEGDLAVVNGGSLVHLVQLDDVETPIFTTIELEPGMISWDAKIQDDLLYLGLQSSSDGSSMLIYDVSTPEAPQLLSKFSSDQFAGAHNLAVQEDVAFLASFGSEGSPDVNRQPVGGRLWLVDVSDPENPTEIGPVVDEDAGTFITRVHDLTVIDSRAYLAAWSNGFYILDFENLDDTENLDYNVVAHHIYEALPVAGGDTPSTHNVWPSADGTKLWTTDEVSGEAVRVFDISDFENIDLLGVFTLTGSNLPHNVVVDGDLAYVAYYRSGLRVLRYDDEMGPIEITEFDTSGDSSGAFGIYTGAWGVYPFGENVLVSDMFGGLNIFSKSEIPDSEPEPDAPELEEEEL